MEDDFRDVRDDELLDLIARRETAPVKAENAWCEFYSRHGTWLYIQLKTRTKLLGRGIGHDDIVVQTFGEVWFNGAARFAPGQYNEADDATLHIHRWLWQIAKNILLNAIKSPKHAELEHPIPEFWDDHALQVVHENADESDSSRIRTLVATVLNEDDRTILWLKMQYYDPVSRLSVIPDRILDDICQRLQITKSLFRKRYQRALEAVFTALKASERSVL